MKALRIPFSAILLVSLLASCCSLTSQQSGVAPEETTSYLVIMSAYTPELTNLLGEADVEETREAGGQTCHLGTLAGNRAILVLSGIGLINAASTTQAVLDSFDVSGIVFSGIAGGINPGLNIGDVTVPGRWGQADGRLDPRDESFWIPVDPTMLEIARDIPGSVVLSTCTPDTVCLEHDPGIILGGNGVSNSFFVDDRVYREWLWDTFEANAVDMETSHVARVARDRGVPYIAFRSLSDLAGGGPGENEIDVFFQLAADNSAVVVMAFLEAWGTRPAD